MSWCLPVDVGRCDEPWRRTRHILLAFRGEMVEVICREVSAGVVKGRLADIATRALRDVVE